MGEFFRHIRLRFLGWLGRPAQRGAYVARWLAVLLGDLLHQVVVELASTLVVAAVVSGSGLIATHWWGAVAKQALAAMAAISALGVMAAFHLRRALNEEPWRNLNSRLNRRCRADNDPHISRIDIRGASRFDDRNFVGGFREIPSEVENILLVLPQTRKRWWSRLHPYTTESISRQIVALEKENPEGAGKIKWVCFTSSHGTFAAYQPFGKFRAQIAIGNVAYAKLLNQEQTPAFYALIEHHRKEEGKLKNGLPADANTIPGLEIGMLPDLPLINREVLVLLQNYKWNEAMLVTPRERKPIGMVTLHKLIHDTMGFELLSPHAEEALKKKIKSWEKDSGVTVAALEKPDNRPAPPADHGDDSPELDAMVPFGANKRTRSALLRFTPP